MFRPMTLFLIAVLGALGMDVAVAYQCMPAIAYCGIAIGFGFGALCRSKEN